MFEKFFLVMNLFYEYMLKISIACIDLFLDGVNFINEQLISDDVFGVITTIFIGVVSLIIALVIFVMDKGDIDKRNIFKVTLINKSNIKGLLRDIAIIIFLLMIQIFVGIEILKILIRAAIVIYTVVLLIEMVKSFRVVLGILMNKNEKENNIDDIFENTITQLIKNNKIRDSKKQESLDDIKKAFNENSSISYDQVLRYDFKYELTDEYSKIRSDRQGEIIEINYQELKSIDNRIKEQYRGINENALVITKLLGERVEEEEVVIYVKKELIELDIKLNINQIFSIDRKVAESEDLITNHIIDVFKEYIDNINNENIVGKEQAEKQVKKLYKILIEKNLEIHIKEFFKNIWKIYNFNNDKYIKSFKELIFNLLIDSLKYGSVEETQKYLNIYYSICKKNSNEEFEKLHYRIELLLGLVDKQNNIINKQEFKEMICIYKRNIYKIFFEHKKYERIIELCTEYKGRENLNDHMYLSLQYKRDAERYMGVDIQKVIEEQDKRYEDILFNVKEEESSKFMILEWARYKFVKTKEDSIKGFFIQFFEKIIEWYDTDDFIELYFEIDGERQIDSWELYEEENRGKVITPECDIKNVIIYGILKAYNDFTRQKLEYRNYINRKYLYEYNDIKLAIERIEDIDLELLQMTADEYKKEKQMIIEYLNEIIKICEKDKKEYIDSLVISEEVEKKLRKKSIELLKEKKKQHKIYTFFEKKGKVKYSQESIPEICQDNISIGRESFELGVDSTLNNILTMQIENKVMKDARRLSQELLDAATETEKELDGIIENFKNKKDIVILSSYNLDKISRIDRNNDRCYKYKDTVIPIIKIDNLNEFIIVSDIDSFGDLVYYKLENTEVYSQLDIIDSKGEEEYENRCTLKIHENIKYISNPNGIIFKKKIADMY